MHIIGMLRHIAGTWRVVYITDPHPGDPPAYYNAGVLEIRSPTYYPLGTVLAPECIVGRVAMAAVLAAEQNFRNSGKSYQG